MQKIVVFCNNYSHNFNNIILQRELTLTTKRKLSFERWNFSIKKDLSFDQTKDSTLEDLTISDTIFTEETFSIFIKALSGNNINRFGYMMIKY